jgi:predicted HAD superfamily hydrolase
MINFSKYEITSFDLFDTLFLRKIKKPTDIFEVVEHISNTKNFAKKRILAEKKARERSKLEEITFDKIYDNLDFPNKENLKKLELEVEEDFIFINPKIKNLLYNAKEANKKIILVSDMYLPQKFIEKLLKKFDIYYDKLYLSSTIKKTKASGNLFKYILNDLKTKPQKIIHIGDSYHSDVNIPKQFGINVKFYENHLEYAVRNNLIEKDSNELTLKIVDGLIIHKLSFYDLKKNFWYLLGYKVAGILYFGFLHWLNEQIKKFNIKKLVFCSRDGFIPKKIYDKFFKNTKTYYAFVSRKAVGYKNINEIDLNQKNLKEYFSEFIDNNKLFIVDVGWRGSIQYALEKILKIPVYGFYLGTIDNLSKNSLGYLFSNTFPRKYFNVIQNSFEVVESVSYTHLTLPTIA